MFTSGIGRWWPKTHKIGPADLDRPVIEPQAGGRWYELDSDGSECEIGKVAVWDPPARLVLIWQLNAEWKFDPDLATEVEVQFTPEGSGTRVRLDAPLPGAPWRHRRRMRATPSIHLAAGAACSRSTPKKQQNNTGRQQHVRHQRLWNSWEVRSCAASRSRSRKKTSAYHLHALAPGEHKQPDISLVIRSAAVPAFEHDGFALYETQAILRYLDDVFPNPPLTPGNPSSGRG